MSETPWVVKLKAILAEVLFDYSDWLDREGLVVGEESIARKEVGQDKRTHSDLVNEFLEKKVGWQR